MDIEVKIRIDYDDSIDDVIEEVIKALSEVGVSIKRVERSFVDEDTPHKVYTVVNNRG